MLQNNTQTMLLPNQPFLAQLQQNNQQQIFAQNQQPLLQQNNRQQLLIPNQQPLLQNNRQLGVMPGQVPIVNTQQNIPPQLINQTPILQHQLNNAQPRIIQNQIPVIQQQLNNVQPAIIPNQIPVAQQQLNNVQPPIIPNQTPVAQPQLNNFQPAIIPNQTPVAQPQLNNVQPANIQNQQANIENNETNETNDDLVETEFLQSMINELKESEFACIEYSRGTNQRKVFKSVYNFHSAETFEIYLGKGDNIEDLKNSFICTEISESFQRYCVGTSKRQFDMNMFYNTSDEEVEFTKEPVIKIHRIEGGCCSDRGILTVNYPNDNKRIGIILQAVLANIYDAKNELLYRVKLPFDPKPKNCLQRFCESCCDKCCGFDKNENVGEERDYSNFLIKRLVEKEEQVEDIIVKKKVQEIVGKMENYPLKIIFPVDATPKEKILLIICRIFLLYMMDFSETLREKWYETCKDIAVDVVDSQDAGILGRINDIKGFNEKIEGAQGFFDTIHTAGINKNIISLNNYLDD